MFILFLFYSSVLSFNRTIVPTSDWVLNRAGNPQRRFQNFRRPRHAIAPHRTCGPCGFDFVGSNRIRAVFRATGLEGSAALGARLWVYRVGQQLACAVAPVRGTPQRFSMGGLSGGLGRI
jgi:hypothetical protein